MEIRGSLITTLYPGSANSRTPADQGSEERTNETGRPTEPGLLREYISQGEIVQGKAAGDYREALARARQGMDESRFNHPAPGNGSQRSRQALEAYRQNANSVENGGVELLPRVDGYA